MYKVKIFINQHKNIPDPAQGVIETALRNLEFSNIKDFRLGKCITFDLDTDTEEAAKAQAEMMCQKLLVNSASETYSIEICNKVDCPCPRTSCENHGNCYGCVARHRTREYPSFCFRKPEDVH